MRVLKVYLVLLLIILLGPEGAWEDQWSNRWNLNSQSLTVTWLELWILTFWLVFAQQGYFVVAINPTGSTSFGQELTNAIKEDWGGKPFVGECL